MSPAVVTVARVGPVPLHPPGQRPDDDTLRQRACTELLRQAAIADGLLPADDLAGDDGVISDAATAAIERLLERRLAGPEPDDDACRRHWAAHPLRWTVGERVRARHILLAVTPGTPVAALREHAERLLLQLQSDAVAGRKPPSGSAAPAAAGRDAFAQAARQWSNCTSGAFGGELGWLTRTDCAPEFGRALFGRQGTGLLPQPVSTRFGFHIVEVQAREQPAPPPFEQVRETVRASLRHQAWATALRHLLLELASRTPIQGVDLDACDSPLVR